MRRTESLLLRSTLLLLIAGCASFAAVRPATAEGLSRAERRIVAAVDRGAPAALDLLQRAVDINSGTMNFEGVRAVGRLLAPEFERLGFTTEWIDGAPWGRAGHLVARRPGRQGAPKVLLIGHLDTVFERDSPFQRFERLSGDAARGPGVCDMKGGDVIMLLALQALKEAGVLDRLAFVAVLTGDEEDSGAPLTLARRHLVEAAEWADVAIGFEDGAGDPRTAVIARRGSSSWRLRTTGHPAHSSQIFRPDIGSGAIYEAARILAAFHDALSGEAYLTVNPGSALGGTSVTFDPDQNRGTAFGKTNVVAESAVVAGDLRSISLEQRERAKETMRRIVAAHLPQTSGEIAFDDGYPPFAPSDGNRRLLVLYDRASRDLGFGEVAAVDPSKAGAADVSFTETLVDMAIDGIGQMGYGGHTVKETADLRTFSSQAKRAAVTLLRLAGK
jgi:glutamate carboxypeptidase